MYPVVQVVDSCMFPAFSLLSMLKVDALTRPASLVVDGISNSDPF
jgi:hypothetical protein